jgi:hypothetical protein
LTLSTKSAIVERKLGKEDREVTECLLPALFTPDSSLPAYERMRQVIMGDPTDKKGIFIVRNSENHC